MMHVLRFNDARTKVQPNQIWQGQDDAQSLVLLVRFTVLHI